MHTFDEHTEEALIHVGETFAVVLPENPTTGFRWSFAGEEQHLCMPLDEYFEAASPNPPGQGGHHHWRFRTIQAGSGEISFALHRSWQQADAAAHKFTLHLRVVP